VRSLLSHAVVTGRLSPVDPMMSAMEMFQQPKQDPDRLSMHLPTTLLCTLHQFGEARPSLDEDQLTIL